MERSVCRYRIEAVTQIGMDRSRSRSQLNQDVLCVVDFRLRKKLKTGGVVETETPCRLIGLDSADRTDLLTSGKREPYPPKRSVGLRLRAVAWIVQPSSLRYSRDEISTRPVSGESGRELDELAFHNSVGGISRGS